MPEEHCCKLGQEAWVAGSGWCHWHHTSTGLLEKYGITLVRQQHASRGIRAICEATRG